MRAVIVATALLAGAGADVACGESIWRHLPQLPLAEDPPPLFADLDGDGTSEIIIVGKAQYDFSNYDQALGVLRDDQGDFVIADLLAVTETAGRPVATPFFPTGAQQVMVTVNSDNGWANQVVEYGGLPLSVKRVFDTSMNIHPAFVGDVDGDGRWEIVGPTSFTSPPGVASFDYLTGAQEWVVPHSVGGVVVAQLDADPALEVVAGGAPGLVLDGAGGSLEWSYPSGFPGAVVAGQFNAVPGAPTFASVQSDLRIFRGFPYSPLREYPLAKGTYAAPVFDIDSNGVDDLLIRSYASSAIRVIQPSDGAVTDLPIPWPQSTIPGAGRIRPGTPALIVHGEVEDYFFHSAGMQIVDYPGLTERYRKPIERGPFTATGFGHIGGERDRVVLLSGQELPGDPGNHGLSATVWNAAGDVVARRVGIVNVWESDRNVQVHMADLDGIPGDEIVASVYRNFATTLVVMDGDTLEDRWRIAGTPDSILDHKRPTVVDSEDVDGDGIEDVVLAVKVDYRARIVAVSGVDGRLLWESVTVKTPGVDANPDLVIADVDSDGVNEIVLSFGTAVYAFDPQTHLLDWSYIPSVAHPVDTIAVWGAGDQCHIGTALANERLAIHRCDDRSLVTHLDLPGRAQAVVPLDNTGSRFAVASMGRVWLTAAAGAWQDLSGTLGSVVELTQANALAVSANGDIDLLAGSSVSVDRLRVVSDRLFGHGFEPKS